MSGACLIPPVLFVRRGVLIAYADYRLDQVHRQFLPEILNMSIDDPVISDVLFVKYPENQLLSLIHIYRSLTIVAPPMALFHSDEFSPSGLDMEFAIPVKEYATGTRDFYPGLCLKTTLYGSYSELASVSVSYTHLDVYKRPV